MEGAIGVFKRKLGFRITQLRSERGLTQQVLADRLGYRDRQIINRYEKEGANPTAYMLVQLANALEVSVDELLDFTELE